jgi:CTP-dependent riboflavin kinase
MGLQLELDVLVDVRTISCDICLNGCWKVEPGRTFVTKDTLEFTANVSVR